MAVLVADKLQLVAAIYLAYGMGAMAHSYLSASQELRAKAFSLAWIVVGVAVMPTLMTLDLVRLAINPRSR